MSSSVNGKTVDGCFDGNVMAIGCETSPEDSNPFIIAEYAWWVWWGSGLAVLAVRVA